jgi:hypothetical protein
VAPQKRFGVAEVFGAGVALRRRRVQTCLCEKKKEK